MGGTAQADITTMRATTTSNSTSARPASAERSMPTPRLGTLASPKNAKGGSPPPPPPAASVRCPRLRRSGARGVGLGAVEHDVRLELDELLLADPPHVHQLLHRVEPPGFLAVLDDALRHLRAHPGQSGQLLGAGG